MSLSDILATTDLNVIVDRRSTARPESERTLLAVRFVKASSASEFLNQSLALDETPVAAIPDSGKVYILSPGTHGLVCLQGSSANKAQKATMHKLAKAYTEATGQGLPEYYAPEVDYSKTDKEIVPPVELDDVAGSPVVDDTPEE